MLSLAVKARDSKESLEALRAKGAVPAVLYGPKEGSTPISFDARTFAKVWREAGETTIVKLTGVGEDKDTLIHDVQFHPVTDVAIHADFLVLEKGKKLTLNIPLEFVGASPAEKAGHILVKALHEVEIEVAPAELPKHLDVDVTTLVNVGDHIVASQIKLPPSGVLKTSADEIVASVTAFVEEKIEAPTVAPAEGAAPAAAPATEEKKEA
jgi:large subunit ribosomal protein L25